jgi:hypothetical protein
MINGDMDKKEKFAYIRLFNSVMLIDGHTFCVLVVTAAANTGIDQPLCLYVLHVGLPHCPTTLLQEHGRLVQKEGMTGTFLLHSCCGGGWVCLVGSALHGNVEATEEVPDHSYINLVIESQSP